MRKIVKNVKNPFILIALIGIISGLWTSILHAQDETVQYRLPQGIYIELPEEFRDSIGGELSEDVWLYTNEMAGVYLNKIVESNEMIVQTNNEIIRQQERIIQLLEALVAKPATDGQ